MRRDNREIDQLRTLIEELTIRVNELEERNRQPRTPVAVARVIPEEPPQPPPRNRDFEIGDRVEVTNNYRGQRGLTGVVVRVSDEWIHFETERLGIRRRKRPNLRRI